MSMFCVGYDLTDERKYEPVFEKLKAYGTYSHSLESMWFIVSDMTAGEIRDDLKSVLDEDDKLIVIEVRKHWGSYNLRRRTTDWLKASLI